MKYLQIHNTTNNEPKILEIGVDFDFLSVNVIIKHIHIKQTQRLVKPISIYDTDTYYYSLNFDTLCSLSDCYQSRPLIEIDGFCEFDVLSHYDGEGYLILIEFSGVRFYQNPYSDDQVHLAEYDYDRFNQHSKNIGSIFLPENRTKYPELYNQALKIIKK